MTPKVKALTVTQLLENPSLIPEELLAAARTQLARRAVRARWARPGAKEARSA
jgi:hypothetical protein